MKKTLYVLAFMVLCVSLSGAAEDTEYYSYSYARLSYVKGDVFVQRASDSGFEEGDVNLPIVEGDKIGTREGRAEIHFGKKNYLRIDRQTQLDLIDLPVQGNNLIQIHMLSGDIFLRVSDLQRSKDFEIHTPDASFYILEEGLYRLVVKENIQTDVLVYEGSLEAAGQEGSVLVEENESLYASDGVFLSESNDLYTEYDGSFADWSHSRDELQSRYVAKRYLPDELYEYEIELAYNGRWAYEASFGYVWIPTVRYTSWRPYYNGRWVWYPIIGWTWVSSHSWGWATSRYGRWHWKRSLGWYWIPTARWGPAWVHWHHGYDYLGWSPLSYWNRPVVIVNNHFYGNSSDRYYPAQSRALTVIRKDQLQARNISRIALRQDQVSQVGKISLSARQPNLKSVVDRTSTRYETGSKVLSRSNLRQVDKGYSSANASQALSRAKSTPIRSSSTGITSGVIKRTSTRTGNSGEILSRTRTPSRTVQNSSSSRSAVTKRFPSSSVKSPRPGNTSSSSTNRVVRRFPPTSSSTQSRTVTEKRSPTSTQNKRTSGNVIRKFSSTSTSSASSRGRVTAAPSRSTRSSGPVVRRPSSTSATQRSTSRAPARTTVSSRSSSSNRISTPSRNTSRSSASVSRTSRSSSSSKSSSSRTSRTSSSSRSSASRSSSSKKIKK